MRVHLEKVLERHRQYSFESSRRTTYVAMGTSTKIVNQVVALWAHTMLLFYLVKHTQGQQNNSLQQVFNFSATDRFGLAQLYAEWNKSTPDFWKNLPGWRDISKDPPGISRACPCYSESWQGVLCLRDLKPTPPGFFYQEYQVWIVGLTLTDASLTGSLPPAIGNLSSLASLTLTGNKDLKGHLPSELQLISINLNILDLGGNGFNGSIPATLSYLRQLQHLDLSGNHFDGSLQVDFRNMTWLRTLNLSRNSLGGAIVKDHFQGLKQLIALDLSSNKFTGPLFSLTKSPSLNTLNLSYNNFSGEVAPSNILNLTASPNLNKVDFSNNSLTGFFPDFSAWTNLTLLDLSNNQFQATQLPNWIKKLTNLQVLRLSGSNLTGQIPDHFLQDFKHLETLALDNNQISGTFDIEDVVKLPMLTSLTLRNNNITRVNYTGSSLKAIEKFGINMKGNPVCDQSSEGNIEQCLCFQNCTEIIQAGVKKRALAMIIATSVGASFFAIVVLILSALVFWKARREKQKLQLQVQQHFAENDIKPTIFTFNQLRVATQDFSESTKIGEGSFGAVYKGHLHAHADPVAVKQLFSKNQQSIADFLNEVVVVTAIKHRNLVNLKGCCVREDQRLLVYEYLENNDLEHHLFRRREEEHLTWPTRLNICLGVARGLHYLHTSAQPRIIHRDIKASNILMDQNLQPKIADFGLALFFPDEKSHIITNDIAGTRGYWAPEYATMGKLSEKADVYSFGVLLLEVVSGRRNLDHSKPASQIYLNEWVRELYNDSHVMEVVDPSLSLSKDEELEVRRIISIALLCIQVEPEKRPTMSAVVATLEGSLNLEAEGMQHLSQGNKPLTWVHLEEQPLRAEGGSRMFSSEVTGSSSGMISLTSMGNYSSSQRSLSAQKKLAYQIGGTSTQGAPCGGTMGSSIISALAR